MNKLAKIQWARIPHWNTFGSISTLLAVHCLFPSTTAHRELRQQTESALGDGGTAYHPSITSQGIQDNLRGQCL